MNEEGHGAPAPTRSAPVSRTNRWAGSMPLWTYLALIVNGIILVAFLVFGAYSAQEQSAFGADEIRRDATALTSNIAAASAGSLITESYDVIEQLLLRLVGLSTVQEIVVADAKGRIVSRVRRNADGQPEAVYAPDASIPIAAGRSDHLTEDSYVRLASIDRGEIIGWVRVTSSLTGLKEMREHIWRDTLLALLLTVVATGALLAWALRHSVRSLERAADFAGELTHQHGGSHPVNSSIREIRVLQKSLNAVSADLNRQYQALQDSQARKAAILEAALDCIITIDESGRIVDFNPAAETTFGYAKDEVIGETLAELIVPPEHRAAHAAGMRRYLRTGEGPVLNKRIELTALRRSGEEFPVELAIVPFVAGGMRYFSSYLRDISATKALEAERVRVAELLRQTVRDLEQQKFALDQHAIVSIADREGRILYANDKFVQISQYSRQELLGQNHRVIKSGLMPSTFYEELWATISAGKVWHGEIAERRKNGETYWVESTIVPLVDDQWLPYQYISIQTDITPRKRTEMALAESRERELAVGNQIQRALLFGEVPTDLERVAIAAHTEPSQGIDGDFYEFFHFGPDRFDIAVGDVMGKGIPAALIGAALKNQLTHVLAEQVAGSMVVGAAPDPVDLINAVHHKVTRHLIDLDSFVTLAYFRVDLAKSRLTYVDAGHTRAILAGADGLRLLSGDNLPLGVLEDEHYRQEVVQLASGDLLFLYSDGVTEAKSPGGEEYGQDRLAQRVRELRDAEVPPAILVQAVRQSIHAFEEHASLSDDRTCLAMQLLPQSGSSPGLAQLELPWSLPELDEVRGAVARIARAGGMAEEDLAALTLATFEAATNVVRHAPRRLPDATIACRIEDLGDAIEVRFDYLGEPYVASQETLPDFSGESESGFGLYIIRQAVDDVDYRAAAEGVCRIRLTKRKTQPTVSMQGGASTGTEA